MEDNQLFAKFLEDFPSKWEVTQFANSVQADESRVKVRELLTQLQNIKASKKKLEPNDYSFVQELLSQHISALLGFINAAKPSKVKDVQKQGHEDLIREFRTLIEKNLGEGGDDEEESDDKSEGHENPEQPPKSKTKIATYHPKTADLVKPFSGNVLDFDRFIEHYEHAIHETDAKDGIKFERLMEKLPKEWQSRFLGHGASEYTYVMKVLKDEFRSPNKIQTACSRRVAKLQRIDDTRRAPPLWNLFWEFASCIKILKKDPRNHAYMNGHFYNVMLALFPCDMVITCTEKLDDEERDITILSDNIRKHIEKIERQCNVREIPMLIAPSTSSQPTDMNRRSNFRYNNAYNQNAQNYRNKQTQNNYQRKSFFKPQTNKTFTQYKSEPGNWTTPCFFCKAMHSQRKCTELPPSKCLEMVKADERCLYCLSKHAGNCRAYINCPICKERHTVAICPKRKVKEQVNNIFDAEMPYSGVDTCFMAKLKETGLDYIPAIINNVLFAMLFDVGATVNIINTKIIEKLQLKYEKIHTPFKMVDSIGYFVGQISIPTKIGVIEKTISYQVIDNEETLILGHNGIDDFQIQRNPGGIFNQLIDVDIVPIPLHINDNFENPAHMVNFTDSDQDQDHDLKKLLERYDDIFSKEKYDIGRVKGAKCHIDLINQVPINLRPYKCSAPMNEIINTQINELLKAGLIQKSISPYSCPIVMVDKKDEGKNTRMCVDYRKLNAITIPENYPMPRMVDIEDRLLGAKFFSTIDIASGFHHIEVAQLDRKKTAFVTMNEQYEWVVMPFGLRNAPLIFQRIIYSILKQQNLCEFAHNYIDDIIIFSKTREQHLEHLEKVFKAMQEENIKLKLSKCKFMREQVKYLGHEVSYNTVKPISSNIEAILEYPAPTNLKTLRGFLGKVNYYHRFIVNRATLLNPLYELLKKDKKWEWTSECQQAFEKVKTILTTEPVLTTFDPDHKTKLQTDASNVGIGAILKQYDPEREDWFVVGYFSRKLHSYQRNYAITEKECLAIIEAIEYWHPYLYGREFTIVTDHLPLRWIMTQKKPNTRLHNWSMRLNQYKFNIEYIPGSQNGEADFLSRNPNFAEPDQEDTLPDMKLLWPQNTKHLVKQEVNYYYVPGTTNAHSEVYTLYPSTISQSNSNQSAPVALRKDDFKTIQDLPQQTTSQDLCTSLKNDVFAQVNTINIDNLKEMQKPFLTKLPKKSILENGLIRRVNEDQHRFFIPKETAKEILEQLHKVHGHIGAKQMIQHFSLQYFTTNQNDLAQDIVSSCDTCLRIKKPKYLPGHLGQIGEATKPLQIVHIDTVGGFAKSRSTHRFLHLAIDTFSRYVFHHTSKTQMAGDFVKLIKNIQKIGTPELIVADRYPSITSNIFKKYLDQHQIKIMFTPTDHPSSNGIIERANQTIASRIRCKFWENANRAWTTLAQEAVEEYNNTIHTSTTFTPNYLLTKQDPTGSFANRDYQKDMEIALEQSKKSHEINKKYFDKRHPEANIKIGDKVYVKEQSSLNRKKLDPEYSGPFEVSHQISENIFRVKNNPKQYHVSQMKKMMMVFLLLGLILGAFGQPTENLYDYDDIKFVSPLLWRKTHHSVSEKNIDATVQLTLFNPCSSIVSKEPEEENSTNTLMDFCNKQYKEKIISHFVTKCNSIDSATPATSRRKRAFHMNINGGDIWNVVASAALGFYTTNVNQKLSNLKEEFKAYKMDTMKRQEISQEIHQKILPILTDQEKRLTSALVKTDEEMKIMVINEVFTAIGKDLHVFFEETDYMRFPSNFGNIFKNISICENCPQKEWHYNDCSFDQKEEILIMNIAAIKVNKDALLLYPESFNIVDEFKTENYCFYRYAGPPLLYYDLNKNCTQDIFWEPKNEYDSLMVIPNEDCTYHISDPRKMFKKQYCTEDTQNKVSVQFKMDDLFYYIYCYTHKFNYNQEKRPCPNAVMRFHKNEKVKINKVEIIIPSMIVNKHINIAPEISEFLGQRIFESEANGNISLYEDLRKLIDKESSMTYTQIQYLTGGLTIILFAILAIFMVIIVIWICCRGKNTRTTLGNIERRLNARSKY